ncbi:MAG TPA: Tad domain-containing protein, partial [Abditibacteriaceae bacterium]|nr:Tad domain-containing protein [Abditibacteriaceae bacterium]
MKMAVQRREPRISKTSADSYSRRKGSALVVVAASLFMFLGFCALSVDYGTSVVVKNRLQRMCDAAALAGAVELLQTKIPATDEANARAQAIEAASKNGTTLVASNITFSDNSTKIRINKIEPRKFLFGAAIGIPNGQVPATALAGRTYVTGLKGLDPLGVTNATYQKFVPNAAHPNPGVVGLVLTRDTKEKFGPMNSDNVNNGNTAFNVSALDLRHDNSGNSGAQFQTDLTFGNDNTQLNIGDQVDPLGSSVTSQGQKIERAILDRIEQAKGAPW